MSTRFQELVSTHQALTEAAALLRKAAAEPKTEPVPHTASAAAAVKGLDMDQVRETLEDLAAQGLTRKASVDAAVQEIADDPNAVCRYIRNMGMIALKAHKAAAEKPDVAEAPGALVGKTASSPSRKRFDIEALFEQEAVKIEARAARR